MDIIRFSKEAFKPQFQSHHLKNFEYAFNYVLNDFPKHMHYELERMFKEKREFYTEHKSDLEYGVWCFISGYKNNQSLNHLNTLVPCYSAYIPDNVEGYSVNLDKVLKISDPLCKVFGVYLPKRSLVELTDIKRVRKGRI